eukprot:scaffold19697_cov90-Isochrysis_galbana.AAC.1
MGAAVAPCFPMDDDLLLHKEVSYRAYLVASARSAPADDGPASALGRRGGAPPAYVYPPALRRPAPPILPPLPTLPTAWPVALAVRLGYSGTTRLLVLWDMCARLGGAFQLTPRRLPLHALAHALACHHPIDYALATQLHCAMLRVIARDVTGADDPLAGWAETVGGPLLALTWPALTAQLLAGADDFEAYSAVPAAEAARGMAAGEWVAATEEARVGVLGWLADRVLQARE